MQKKPLVAIENFDMFTPYTLDQLTAFLAVVEEGTFSGAGRRLGRVQSAVSYAIAQLEAALGSRLFERGGRTVVLTDAGRRLAAEARLVLSQARALSEVAAGLQQQVEPELTLVVDPIYPLQRLGRALQTMSAQFPTVLVRVESALLSDASEVVRGGRADLGICNLAADSASGLHTRHLGVVTMVPVCAPSHPLARTTAPQDSDVLTQHTQVVQSQRLASADEDQGVLSPRTWRVTALELKERLILDGIGWGSLPASRAEPLLAVGRLVRLAPVPWPADGHRVDLHAVHRAQVPLGPAAQHLRDALLLAS